MAGQVARGEVWLHRFAPPDKRRPVVVISRQDVINLISTVLVAPVTSTVRGLPSEVPLDVGDGTKGPCAVNLDHVHAVRKADLSRCVATLVPGRMKAGPEATIGALVSVAPYFKISRARVKEVLARVEHAVAGWRKEGRSLGMTNAELEPFVPAFEHSERGATRIEALPARRSGSESGWRFPSVASS